MIELNTNVDTIISQLKQYRDSLQSKTKTMLERLAEIGIDTAQVKFASAQYDGDNDVVVTSTPQWISDTELAIKAEGSAVTFIEFGAGVFYPDRHPMEAELGFIRGEYGEGKGSNDSWGYYGNPGTNGRVIQKKSGKTVVITHGNPPARGMYEASKDMRNKIIDIAREVYGSNDR